MTISKHPLTAVVITTLFLLLMSVWFDFHLGYYESIFSAMAYGDLGEPAYNVWNMDFHFLIYPVLVKLSQWFSNAPVYGIWLFTLNFIWITLLVRLWQVLFAERLARFDVFFLLSFGLLFVLAANSTQRIHTNRISIWLAGISMLLYYYDRHAKKPILIFYFLAFLLAVLTRWQTALFSMSMVLLHVQLEKRSTKKLLKRYQFHLLTVFLVATSYFIVSALDKNVGKTIETRYEFAILDRQLFYPLGDMKTSVDSAKYMAVTNYLISDSAQMTGEFLSRTVKFNSHFTQWLQPEALKAGVDVFVGYLVKFWPGLVTFLFCFMAALFPSKNKATLLRKVGLQFVLFFFIIFLLSISFNMFDRVFTPMRGILLVCCTITCLFEISSFVRADKVFTFLCMVIVTTSLYKINRMHEVQHEADAEEKEYTEMIKKYETVVNTNKKVMVLRGYGIPYTLNPFERKYHHVYSRLILADVDFITYYDFLKKKIINTYGFSPVDFKAMHKFMIDNSEDLIVLSPPQRIAQFKTYYHDVYGLDLNYRDTGNDIFEPHYRLYHILKPDLIAEKHPSNSELLANK